MLPSWLCTVHRVFTLICAWVLAAVCVLQYVSYLSWEHRLVMLHDVACGMLYLHSRGYVHGDLRSPSLYVTENGRVSHHRVFTRARAPRWLPLMRTHGRMHDGRYALQVAGVTNMRTHAT